MEFWDNGTTMGQWDNNGTMGQQWDNGTTMGQWDNNGTMGQQWDNGTNVHSIFARGRYLCQISFSSSGHLGLLPRPLLLLQLLLLPLPMLLGALASHPGNAHGLVMSCKEVIPLDTVL
jgi:hypothetical protein